MADLDRLLALDAANRTEALDIRRSFIVQAPAGAGKTELLTQRFLTLLNGVENPEEIVALTFTNKAAAEMRERILDSLGRASRGELPSLPHKQRTHELSLKVLARDRDRNWSLLEHAGRLQITTLDALCGRLARQMPILSRFGGQPAIVTDSEEYYRQAAGHTLDQLESAGDIGDVVARVLAAFDHDRQRLEGLLVAMLGARDQWLPHALGHRGEISRSDAEAAMACIVRCVLEDVSRVMTPALQQSIMSTARYVAAQAILARQAGKRVAAGEALARLETWTAPLRAEPEDLPRWRSVAELVLTGEGKIRSSVPQSVGLTQKDPEGPKHAACLKECYQHLKDAGAEGALSMLRKLAEPAYGDEEWALIEDVIYILKMAAANLWVVFQEAGKVDFIQIAQNALQALGAEDEPTDLALQLDYQIRHLLVDEFQDTSPTQVELLTRLTNGWMEGDGRSLFLVGDPMQSIYRFRKADVSLFLQVRERGIGALSLTPLQLYRNNRSHQEVVAWVNTVFPGIFSARDDTRIGAVRFEPAAPTKGAGNKAKVAVHGILGAAAGEETLDTPADLREAREIISILRAAREEDPQRSIAVLVRARTHLAATVAELRRNAPDLPFQAVEIEALGQRQCILDLVALTRALHHRADRVNWLAILRAPWCGLELEDLHRLAGDDLQSTIWQLLQNAARMATLSPEGQKRLAHLRGVLAEAFAGQGRQRPRRWVEGVWQSLGGAYCLKAESDFLDVTAYFHLLDQLEEGGHLDLARLERQLDRLYAAPDPNAPREIQIMTIHKSKGLEFDTVILPGLHRKPKSDDSRLLIWDRVMVDSGEECLAIGCVPAGDAVESDEPGKYALLQEFEKTRAANEARRLLYVAVTRAIRQLHLVAVVEAEKEAAGEGELILKAPPPTSLLSLLWPACGGELLAQASVQALLDPAGRELDAMDPKHFSPRLERLQEVGFSPFLCLAEAAQEEVAPVPDGAGDGDSLAVDIGILTHRYLELIAGDGLGQWPVSRLDGLESRLVRWFGRRDHSRAESLAACAKTLGNLRSALNSETGRWILGDHQEAACEYPLTTDIDGLRQSHVIDRTFVADGVRWIIDYKTTTVQGDTEAFFLAKLAGYREQLTRYAGLFRHEGREVRAALYFPEYDRFCSLPLAPPS